MTLFSFLDFLRSLGLHGLLNCLNVLVALDLQGPLEGFSTPSIVCILQFHWFSPVLGCLNFIRCIDEIRRASYVDHHFCRQSTQGYTDRCTPIIRSGASLTLEKQIAKWNGDEGVTLMRGYSRRRVLLHKSSG